ncbi:DUF167 domain-containing protein [Bacteriovorax sp. Seq25_V]|uniref:DUF167 domain-containing protein n=1 Tax=Bacteriovorax sp. Seq25_V TaxID=1201288 RepID=UPI000389FBBC|nr:DUF167 domain-containing protein [Bacteriovorax sp. Seq25_V]EQC47487.1 TIGR00251 family protein [Bacteriovorax sp. Seq25_V]
MINELCEFLQTIGIETKLYRETDDGGVLSISVWAKPGSKVEKCSLGETGEIVLYFREKPIEGKANKAIAKSLGKILGVGAKNVEIDQGEKSRHKKILLYFAFTNDKNLSYYKSKFAIITGN